MWHVLVEMFGWPSGNVVGNLCADALTFTAGVVVGRRSLSRLHAKLDRHHETLDKIHSHTAALHQNLGGGQQP